MFHDGVTKAKLSTLEWLKKLKIDLRLNDEEVSAFAENLFYDSSHIQRSLNEVISPSIDTPTTSKQPTVKYKENTVIEINCRNFIFRIKTILEDPIDFNRVLAMVNETHNLFLKDSDEAYQKLGAEFSGMNFLGSHSLRDLLDRFQILLKAFPELQKDLKQWIARAVKPNPVFELLTSPLLALTIGRIHSARAKFYSNKGPHYSARGRGRGRGRGGRYRGRGRGRGNFNNNSQDQSNPQPQPKAESKD